MNVQDKMLVVGTLSVGKNKIKTGNYIEKGG